MKFVTQSIGMMGVNTYVLHNRNRECIIVDCPKGFQQVENYLKEHELNLIGLILTHAHFDHMDGLDELLSNYNIPIFMNNEEFEWLTNPSLNGSKYFPGIHPVSIQSAKDVRFLEEGQQQIGDFNFFIYKTPGHSPGSIAIYFKEERVIFTGDTLFSEGVGRTDLYGGDQRQLKLSIKDKLYKLPNDTKVYPGHGSRTTLVHEKKHNPFVRE